MRIVVTGGLGFIGSSFVHHCVENGYEVKVVDLLTYAGNYDHLNSIKTNPLLVETLIADICDVTPDDLGEYDYLVNFAAESHVDNSIVNGRPFVRTNVEGTFNLLECARQNPKLKRFIQISTDEVYGDLEKLNIHHSLEGDKLFPSSYYSSTKASADLLVESCGKTYGLPYTITRTCNNFGVRQHKEKFIPKIIHNIKNDIPIPIYGDGKQMREWIWVEDNVRTSREILEWDDDINIYHIGSGYTVTNLDIINMVGRLLGRTPSYNFVEDRKGHDRKYKLLSYNKVTKSLDDYLKEQIIYEQLR